MEEEEYLYNNNITLDYINIKNEDTSGIYLHINGKDFFGIDKTKINNNIEKRCILQHEIAHHQLGLVYTVNNSLLECSKIEYKTDKRLIHNILPFDKLINYIQRNKPDYTCEIAEEFCVTEDIVNKALKMYAIIN